MPSPTIVDSSTSGVAGTSTIDATIPGGASSGNLLIVVLSIRASHSVTGVPSGWTLRESLDTGGLNAPYVLIYTHDYAGTGSPWTWTISSSTGGNSLSCLAIDGWKGETDYAYADSDTGTNLSIVCPTATANGSSDLSLRIVGWKADGSEVGSVSWPTSTEETDIQWPTAGGSTVRLGNSVAYEEDVTGAVGTETATLTITGGDSALTDGGYAGTMILEGLPSESNDAVFRGVGRGVYVGVG
jgi:hypothetical protein